MVRITIDIGPSRKTGGVEAFGLGMMMPFVIDAVLGMLAPAPPAPELVPEPAHPRMPPFVEWLHRAIAEVMVAPPAPATAAAADKSRLADFVTTMLRELRPRERELLRRRFGVEVQGPEPVPPAPPGAPAPASGGTV